MKHAKTLTTGVAIAALGLGLIASPALAQQTPASDAPAADNKDVIVVTGSSIKRINSETASPLTVIDTRAIQATGYDNLATVLTNLTSNGAGTLSNSNSEAFAGGASGIALRGLSVGATLVLVDGHRLAPYPLSDDGERQFTDVQSIPLFAVERVEVLKDGASAIYGSDAIAGVVNVILKKQITGAEALFEAGNSEHGGGATQHAAFAFGKGDISRDGYNWFVTAEYHNQDQILLAQRADYAPWGNLNFSRFGGNDIRPGAPNAFNAGQPATLDPYLVNANGSYTFLNSSCNTAAMAAGQCTYQSPQKLLSPTRNVNLLVGFTREYDSGWQIKFRASMFDSEGQQSNNGYNTYPGGSYAGNVSNPLTGLPVPAIGLIANYTVPANFLGLGNAAGSYLQGVVAGVGLPTIDIDSKTWRAALDVTGTLAGWDIAAALGGSYVVTTENFSNYVNYDTLFNDLNSGAYNPAGGNSAAEIANIAPSFRNLATDKLLYGDVHASKKLATLPGGDLAVALGASVVHKELNNPGPAPVLSGAIGGTFSTYAIGSETDIAEFLEVDAHVFNTVEINGALRDDYYTSYGNSLTPKLGVTWKAQPWALLRGTFSKGFRAPAPAEYGHSQTLFGLGGFQDPVLCPNGAGGPFPAGTVPASCSEQVGFAQTTSSNLKPEQSTSFTAGAVLAPIKNWTTTVDYYHILIKDQIISASELPTYAFDSTNCVRSPAVAIAGVADGNGGIVPGASVPIAGPLAACFAGYVNAQSTLTSGLDINNEYKFKWGPATIRTRIDWTHVFNYNLTGPNGVTYYLAGTHGPSGVSGDTGNPRDRINASVSVEQGKFNFAVSGYWISSFSVTDPSASGGAQATCAGAWNAALAFAFTTPSAQNSQYCKVASFTSINLVTGYEFTPKVKMTFSIDNLFDKAAPIDAETYGGSFTPVNPAMHMDGIIGRFFRLGLNVKY
jgi:iron complex outermembrane receptor protein